MYHAKSVIDAWNNAQQDNKRVNNWRRLPSTEELITYLSSDARISVSEIITSKHQQNTKNRYLDGTYICESLLIDLAGWVSSKFRHEIYNCFARQAEIDRLNADIDHKQTTIDELKADMKKLLSKNDELLQINRDQTDTLNKMRKDMKSIKASAESIAPIASSLKNRVSSPLSEEYLLVRYSNNNGSTVDVHYKAVNPNTIKKERIDISSYWIHQSFANSVDAQNRLLDLLQSNGMLINLDRRAKSFKIRSYHLNKIRTIIENDLNGALNVESSEISTEVTDIRDKIVNNQSAELFNGYPLDYCTKVCNRWRIDMNILSTIIEQKCCYGKYPMRLHPTDGLCYRRNVNGKTIYYKLPYDAFE